MAKYEEIIKLHNMLVAEGIEHEFKTFKDGYMVVYPSLAAWDETIKYYDRPFSGKYNAKYNELSRDCVSAVETSFSYGSGADKIEIMGMLTADEAALDDVAVVTADEAFARIVDAEKRKAAQ